MLEKPGSDPYAVPGDGVHLAVRVDAGGCHHLGDHLLRQQIIQRVAEIVVAVFFKIGQQSAVQLRLVQTGLEVDLQVVALLVKAAPYGQTRTKPAVR